MEHRPSILPDEQRLHVLDVPLGTGVTPGAVEPEQKAFLLQMAQNWRKLAEHATRTQTLVDSFNETSLR